MADHTRDDGSGCGSWLPWLLLSFGVLVGVAYGLVVLVRYVLIPAVTW